MILPFTAFGVAHPIALALLPLALLPLLASPLSAGGYSWGKLVPEDAFSVLLRWALRILAMAGIAALILGVAGLYRAEETVERLGKGAHIVLLFDRSSSMDQTFAGRAPEGGEASKAKAARRLLSEFAARRANDLFGVAAFSTQPLFVLPLTNHREAVQAAIAASDRPGLAFTNIGKGLAMALSFFQDKPMTGSRVIMLVSDGAGVIDHRLQLQIRTWFEQYRARLYWIFLRTEGSAGIFDEPASPRDDTPQIMPERHLHKFFQSLKIPYRAYEAADPKALEEAIADVDRLENLPLQYLETIPRKNLSSACYVIAAVVTASLLAAKLAERRIGV